MSRALPLAAALILAACSATGGGPVSTEAPGAAAGKAGIPSGAGTGGDGGGAGAPDSGGSGGAQAGSGPAGAGAGGKKTFCDPDDAKVCTCAGGVDGIRKCLPDGSTFGPCKCAPTGKAGAAGSGGSGSAGGDPSPPAFCSVDVSPISGPETATECSYGQTAAADECGPECGTGKHLYFCGTGQRPPAAAGGCASVGDYAQGKRVCCAEKACARYSQCFDGRDAYLCPDGVALQRSDCEAPTGTTGYFCCGVPQGSCKFLSEPDDTRAEAKPFANGATSGSSSIEPGGQNWRSVKIASPVASDPLFVLGSAQPASENANVRACVGGSCAIGTGTITCTKGVAEVHDGLAMCCNQLSDTPMGTLNCGASTSSVTYVLVTSSSSVCVDVSLSVY